MQKLWYGWSVLLSIMPIAHVGSAQESHRAPESISSDTIQRGNSAAVLFERTINTYDWIGRTVIDTVAAGTRTKLRGQHVSNIIVIGGHSGLPERRLQSDRQDMLLALDRPVSSTVSARAEWSSFVFSDKKAVGVSAASIHSLLTGIRYEPLRVISFSPMVGYRWERQSGVADRGLTYNISTQARDIDVDGYRFGGLVYASRDLLDPRILEKHFARIGIQKSFLGRTRDSLGLAMSRNRREFYTSNDASIESRTETIYSFANLLDYEVDRSVLATLFVSVAARRLDKGFRPFTRPVPPTQRDEFQLNAYLEAQYGSGDGGTIASARFAYSERDEVHSAKLSDNVARRTSLSGMIALPLSSSDTFSCSGTGSILRYDTPSDLNSDDRDELLVALSFLTSHRINQFLDLRLSLDGNLSHTVYLFAARSDHNNVNRVLRLMPRLTYRPLRGLATMNAFEVLANYTVYDFEEQLLQLRSFSYRQFGWVDSTSVEMTPRIGLDFHSYVKLYERGQLNWGEFTERTENSFVDETYSLRVRFEPQDLVLFAAGFRYFRQSRYIFEEGRKRLESSFRSAGPTCAIFWLVGPRSQISMQGWFEQRRQADSTIRAISNITMNIQLTF